MLSTQGDVCRITTNILQAALADKILLLFFLLFFYSGRDASIILRFVLMHSNISWHRSEDWGGAGFELGTIASSVLCRPVD
jgi:hypothetical protein